MAELFPFPYDTTTDLKFRRAHKKLAPATRKTGLSLLAKPWRATARNESINNSTQPAGQQQKIETLQTKDLGSLPARDF
jgi:hypothetical protein